VLGPKFALRKNGKVGLQVPEHSRRKWLKIEGKKSAPSGESGKIFPRKGKTGARCGCQDDLDIPASGKTTYQRSYGVQFPDTYRLDPNSPDPLAAGGYVPYDAKPVRNSFPIPSTPPHPPEILGQQKEESGDIKNAIDNDHSFDFVLSPKATIMNKKKTLCALVLPFLAVVLSLPAARPFPHNEKSGDLPVDPAVEWGTLENGIRYAILPWEDPPDRLSLRLLVEAGSFHETERQKGLAHLIEHMAFNGTENFSAGEMVEYFQRLGMAFGPDTNAHTGWKETVYKLELPEAEGKILERGLTLLRDYADGMLLEREEIEKEKGVVLSELRDRDTPAYQAYVDELKFAAPQARLSERFPIGDADVIRMSKRQDLVDFYRKWYIPDRMVLVGVGDIDPDRLLEKFRQYFGDMQNPDTLPKEPANGTLETGEERFRLYSNSELPRDTVGVYARRSIEPRADTLSRRLTQEKRNIANAILSRRLERLSKKEDVPITGGSGYDYRWMEFIRYTGLSLSTRSADWREALDLGMRELKTMKEHGVTAIELKEAVANRVNALEESAHRAATRKSRDLSNALVQSVRNNRVFIAPDDLRDLLVPKLEAVSPQSAAEVFRKAWNTSDRLVYVSGNFAREVEDSYSTAKALPAREPDAGISAEFAYTEFGETGKVVKDHYHKDLSIRQLTFANGVRLNLKQTDFEANTVRVGVSFGHGGIDVPPDQPGLRMLAQQTFLAGGLGEHTEDQLKQLLAGKTVSSSFSVAGDFFQLNGTTSGEDLRLQLQVLAAYLTDPAFREEGRRVFLRQLDALYTRLEHNPMGVLQDKAARYLAGGDYRFGFPERSELEARTMNEVREWMANALRKGYLEIAVVGDFSNEKAVIEMVQSTFGAIPERNNTYERMASVRDVTFPAQREKRVYSYASKSNRAVTTVNWGTTGQTDIEKVRRLSLLARVFSDRMRVQIREAIGEAYSPYAFNNSSEVYPDYGYLRALVPVDPAQTNRIEKILFQIADDLVEKGLSEDELVRAVEPVKNQIEEYRRTNAYWLNSVLLRAQAQPQRLAWARSFAAFWDSVKVQDLEKLADEYLVPDNAIPVQVVPRS